MSTSSTSGSGSRPTTPNQGRDRSRSPNPAVGHRGHQPSFRSRLDVDKDDNRGDEHEEEEEGERLQRDRAYSLPNLSEWALEAEMSRDMAVRPPSDPRTRLLSDEEDREQDMRYYFEYYQYAAYKEQQKGSLAKRAFNEALSAVAGSLFAASFTYPIDFAKTRLQVPGNPYKGAIDALRTIAVEEGAATLYRGFSSEIYRASLQNFFYFFSYTSLKELAKLLDKNKTQLSIGMNLGVGVAAGCIASFFITPLTVVQTRMITAAKTGAASSDGVPQVIRRILRDEGLNALFAGLMPSFVLTLNPAIQYLVYDRLKGWWLRQLQKREKPRPPSALELFFIGAIAKAVATVATYPYIMARVRLQLKPVPGQAVVVYAGAWDVIVKIVQKEGFLGVYRGLQPQLINSVLKAALLLMAMEKVKEIPAVMRAVSTRVRALIGRPLPEVKREPKLPKKSSLKTK